MAYLHAKWLANLLVGLSVLGVIVFAWIRAT